MDTKDWITIIAALLGPVLAVQAQKAVESFRARTNRKMTVFSQLMATRAAKVSPDHVRALNMIDLVFYGYRILGMQWRTKKEQAVLDAWKEYHDHLYTEPGEGGLPPWTTRGEVLFTNLLFAIAQDVDYTFDRVQLKKGVYSPVAHDDLALEEAALRRCAIRVLSGETPIKMNVVGFPVDAEATEAHHEAIRRLSAALEEGTLKVKIKPNEEQHA